MLGPSSNGYVSKGEWFLYNYGMLQFQSIQRIGCINILLESVLCSRLADSCGFAREYKATGYHPFRITHGNHAYPKICAYDTPYGVRINLKILVCTTQNTILY